MGNNLIRSDDFFFERLTDFCSQEDISLVISPFIKNDSFKEILNQKIKIHQVIARWRKEDIISGSSDLELYETCVNRGIKLFINPRIHLKVFIGERSSCFLGSANISQRGLNYPNSNQYNYEIATVISDLDFNDKLYFQKILQESMLVTSDIYEQLKNQTLEKTSSNDEFEILTGEKDFLISSLPMSKDIETLFKVYQTKKATNEEEMNCAVHDLALYGIIDGLNKKDFVASLKQKFNSHPFILELKSHIKSQPNQSLRYGGVVNWILKNTTTVPIPRSWELKQKQIVNILYEWICFFDEEFSWSIPGAHSQVIFYNK